MPHVVIEHFTETPADFDGARAMRLAFDICAGCGFIKPEDLKLRTTQPEAILFGDGRRSFIHVTVLLLAGRSDAMKLDLSRALVAALREAFPKIAAISTDIRDMNPDCYKKSLA